jgi:hypothetical protein
MIKKRIVCSDRLRRVPNQFSWIDHALVRRKYICGHSHGSLALYLFLVTVADGDGLSYYSDTAIRQYLRFTAAALDKYRAELCGAGLIAYSNPFYQVLSLNEASATVFPAPCETARQKSQTVRTGAVESIGQILSKAMGEYNG